jgi:hypothetical protein
MLTNFEIQDFRAFSHLRVERLGRVNLVVGRNNVGKTMFLEALRLHALSGSPAALRNLLLERDEVIIDIAPAESDETDFQLRIASLFYRRSPGNGVGGEIRLGPSGNPSRTMAIRAKMLRRIRMEGGPGYTYEVVEGEEEIKDEPTLTPGLVVTQGSTRRTLPISWLSTSRARTHRQDVGIWPAFVPARGVPEREIARWWDAVALHDAEQRVIECLRLISPVDRINLIEHPARRGERLVMVKVASEPSPIPLKSLGDGMARMFQIALALECSRTKGIEQQQGDPARALLEPSFAGENREAMLLIDEIENGIHYTVLPKLWNFILRVAKLHDVQVFATSHSWDCIQGLQEAAADVPDASAMLIRLERLPQLTKAVQFDQKELAIVTRDNIEVR